MFYLMILYKNGFLQNTLNENAFLMNVKLNLSIKHTTLTKLN